MLDQNFNQVSEEKTLSSRLVSLRKQKGLTMREAARRVGVSVSTYRDWEYGRKIPACKIVSISKALRVTVNQILGVRDEPNRENLRAALHLIEDARKMIFHSL